MDKNNIKFLQKNLKKIVKVLNYWHQEIWWREYPLLRLNYKKNVDNEIINKVNNLDNFVLYINVPVCTNKCSYCRYYRLGNINKFGSNNYINCLKAELDNISKFNSKQEILSILIGGGTPNLLTPNDIKELMDYIYNKFKLSSDIQVSIEATPYNFTKNMAKAIVDARIDKICLGVQTFNENTLREINRPQKNKDVYNAVYYLKEAGHKNISFDLIYGLTSKEKASDFLDDNLKHILKLKPQNIDIYPLQEYEKFPERIYDFSIKDINIIVNKINSGLSAKAAKRCLSLNIGKKRKSYGSHYFQLRRVLLKNTFGVGLGAIGGFWIDDKFILRRNNAESLIKYKDNIENSRIRYDYFILDEKNTIRKYIINSLGTGINKSIVEQKFNKSSKLFYSILDNVKDFLNFSDDEIFLKHNYEVMLPFQTKNEFVNYFILSFCYFYSDSDRKKLIKKIQNIYEK